MTNKDTILERINLIRKYLKILDGFKDISEDKILSDIILQGALERYLYLAVQSTIDLAESVISIKKLRRPSSMSESFEILCEEKIIDEKLSQNLINMVGFRNIVVHDYTDLNYDIVFDVLKNKLPDIKNFASSIEKTSS